MSNDQNAKALIDALLPALTEALKKDVIPQIVEEQIGGLKKKNTELLDKLQDAKREQPAKTLDPNRTVDRNGKPFDAAYTREMEDQHLAFEQAQAQQHADDIKRKIEHQNLIDHGKKEAEKADAFYISRDEARDPVAYRKAKEDAAAAGKPLRVGSTEEFADAHNREAPAPLTKHIVADKERGTLYMSREKFKEIGHAQANRMAAQDGLSLSFINSDDDIPAAIEVE